MREYERAVSPTIGIVLMVAVTVLLSAGVFVAVQGTVSLSSDDAISTSSAVAGSKMTVDADKVLFQSLSGSGLDVSNLKAIVNVDGKSVTLTEFNAVDGNFTATGDTGILNGTQAGGTAFGPTADTEFSPGETIVIPLNSSQTESATVRVTAVNMETDRLIRTTTREKPRATGDEILLAEGTKNAKVTISNPTSHALSNYQVKVTVDYQSEMNKNFSDIRFVQNEANLDYWVVSKTDGSQATVWVEVADIPSSGTEITLNYGDSSRKSASDARATLVVYDLHGGNGVAEGVLSGDARLVNGGTSSEFVELTDTVNSQMGVLDYNATPAPGFYVTYDWYTGDGNGADSLNVHAWNNGTYRHHEDPHGAGYSWFANDHDDCIGVAYDDGGDPQCGDIDGVTSVNPALSTWKSATVWAVKNGSSTMDYHYETLGYTMSGTVSSAAFPGNQFGFGARTGGLNNHHWVRAITVRKYAGADLTSSITY